MEVGIMKASGLKKMKRPQILTYAYFLIVVVLTYLPFYLMLGISVKDVPQFLDNRFGITFPFHWENYYYALLALWRPLVISVIVAAATICLTLTVGSLSAYAFARFDFPGRKLLFYSIIMLMMIPGLLTLVPRYVIVVRVGLVNSLGALILPMVAGGQVVQIFILRTFFRQVPDELIDACKIDGASRFTIFSRIMLPLSVSILATLGMMQLLGVWNDFLWPLIVINDAAKRPLALAIRYLSGSFRTEWGMIMAGYVLGSAPTLLLFAVATKPFIRGMTSGAIKV